uniref:Sec20 C-terminal domain-containing protein n=1 Tax=Phaeomonas parva TaxID=124430 RepID=A0A7S1TXF7_9STRA|mmetsp:Transcript_19872/g.60204  ORF Transcript_19872/g.60204 Transcript_19872/m.60204 type:complete len:246 (+) Transcript_19872:255-992(+)
MSVAAELYRERIHRVNARIAALDPAREGQKRGRADEGQGLGDYESVAVYVQNLYADIEVLEASLRKESPSDPAGLNAQELQWFLRSVDGTKKELERAALARAKCVYATRKPGATRERARVPAPAEVAAAAARDKGKLLGSQEGTRASSALATAQDITKTLRRSTQVMKASLDRTGFLADALADDAASLERTRDGHEELMSQLEAARKRLIEVQRQEQRDRYMLYLSVAWFSGVVVFILLRRLYII